MTRSPRPHLSLLGLLFTLCLVLPGLGVPPALSAIPASWPADWVVSASEVAPRVAEATVLDARSRGAWEKAHVPGAVHVSWTDFSKTKDPSRGKLLAEDAVLQKKLRALGISDDRPVLVVGDPRGGWGEEGRIVWMLRTLGHEKAAMVDGGHAALEAAGVRMAAEPSKPAPGDFTVRRRDDYEVQRDAVKAAMGAEGVVLLDTREPREFAGATPYGERRGGHVPGAKHLYYQELLKADGTLKPAKAIAKVLAARGIEPGTKVYAYCTGGVRSAWLVAVLRELGYDAKNYAGSMWDWSAAPAAEYPLATPEAR